mgnify:CR=1 FL=1
MQRSRNDASESIRAADIPLRPEVIQCMDVQSLGRLTCCSATVRKDVREAKAWQLLSNVQRPAEESFFAAEREAAAARRSQALRRRLVDQFDRWRAGGPVSTDMTANSLADFTFFLRIDDDQGRIWEGDLSPASQQDPHQDPRAVPVVGFDLWEIWWALNYRWDRMVEFLATDPSDPDSWRSSYLDSLRISLVAVREADQAMVALGQFLLDDALGVITDASQKYVFKPIAFKRPYQPDLKFFWSDHKDFSPFLILNVTHDATGGGGGTLDSLDIGVDMTKYNAIRSEIIDADYLERDQVEYLFTYLAGVHHFARSRALRRINTWQPADFNTPGV